MEEHIITKNQVSRFIFINSTFISALVVITSVVYFLPLEQLLRRHIWLAIMLGAFIIHTTGLKFGYPAERKQKEKENTCAGLQKKMGPHFLYNSLNSIYYLMHTDNDSAQNAIIKLADVYRYFTDKSDKLSIPFEEEWNFVFNYLAIEHYRFSDTVTIDIEKKGDFSDITIPPLTIQPIVENCLKHGLNDIKENGHILIKAIRKDSSIYIEVIDNGKGITENDRTSGSLENTRKRLNYHYSRAEIQTVNREEGGVKTSIKIKL